MTSLMDDLLAYETSSKSPPDGRRVIRDERMRLMGVRDLRRRGMATADRLRAVTAEARRVLDMWRHVTD